MSTVLEKSRRTSKAAAPAPDHETTIAELRAEITRLRGLKEQYRTKRDKIRKLRDDKDFLKGKLKEVNGAIESAVDDLLVDEQPTLFEAATNGKPKPLTEVTPVDETWREVKLADLKRPDGEPIPPSVLEKLAEADIETMGQLTDFSKVGVPLTQIKGIGPAAMEKIEAATSEFWTRRKAEQDAAAKKVDEVVKDVAEAVGVESRDEEE